MACRLQDPGCHLYQPRVYSSWFRERWWSLYRTIRHGPKTCCPELTRSNAALQYSFAHNRKLVLTADCDINLTCGVNSKMCYGPGGSDTIATPSPVSSPSSTTPASPAATSNIKGKQVAQLLVVLHCILLISSCFRSSCCAVAFSASLPAFTVATFQAQQQSDFQAAVLSKATGATACALSNLHDGSLLLDSTVTFPSSNSNAASNAASFKSVLATQSSSVFPSATYGTVTVGSITSTSKL